MRIFAIETSCDETAIALLDVQKSGFVLKKHIVSSQVAIHARYGGVVPEVAARKHSEVLVPLIEEHMGRRQLASVDLIAVTKGPGLITSLMIGVQAGKTLAGALSKPLVGVNHLEAHVYANWLTFPDLFLHPKTYFPALALIVSGGHTELVLMRGHGAYQLLGQTVDDAAGESFDKVAKILDLGYPGGPVISTLSKKGNSKAIDFPRPMINTKDYMMSFSGLKTSVLYYLEKKKTIQRSDIPDVVASFQSAVIDVLTAKTKRAIQEFHPKSLILAGGVSANPALRTSFEILGKKYDIPVFVPALQFTGDNAAMIAVAGYYRRKEAKKNLWRTLTFDPHLRLV